MSKGGRYVDITGLDRAAVLVALFNAAARAGDAREPLLCQNHTMTLEVASFILSGKTQATPFYASKNKLHVSIVDDRAIAIDFGTINDMHDTIDVHTYNRMNGPGKAQQAIEVLREKLDLDDLDDTTEQ